MRRKFNLKLIVGTLAGLFLLSAATYALHEYQVRQNAHRLLERADRAVQEKDHDKALTIYYQYLALVPDDADTVQKYADVLNRRADSVDDRVRLIVLMEQVLRVKPKEDAFRLRLVHNLILLGRYPEAIEHLQKLLTTSKDQAEVYHMIGWCLEAKKDNYAQAAKAFTKAVELDPKRIASAALLAEMQQDRLHLPADALKTMNALVRANPESPEAHLLRARFLRRRGDEDAAERDVQAASKLSPDHPEVILEVADAARAHGQLDEAARLLNDGVKRHPHYAAFHKALADLALRAGKIDDAIAYLQSGLKQAPKNHELAVLLIDLLIDQQRYADARAKLDELLQAGLRPTLPNYLAARLMIADGKWSEAIALLEAARRELAPRSAWRGRVNALLGAGYRRLGDHEKELGAYRRAVEADPTWSAAGIGLAAALLEHGRSDEADQVLEPLRDAKDLPPGYWPMLARARLQRQGRLPVAQRRWDEVEEALAQAERVEPGSLDAPLIRAELQAAQGNADGARAVLEKASAEHPDAIKFWIALADLAAWQKHFEAAEQILEQATAQKANAVPSAIWLAKIGLWSARGSSADQAKLADLSTQMPSDGTAAERAQMQRALAVAWQRLGKADRAAQVWRKIAAESPSDARSRFALFDLAWKANDLAAARRWQRELRDLEGDTGARARFAAASLLVREARGKPAALTDARRQLHDLELMHKDWPRIPLLLAMISEQEGKVEQATEEYGRAVILGDADSRTLARLVELLLARREFSKAESALAKHEQQRPLSRELARLGAESALGMRDRPSALLAVRRAEYALALPSRDYRDYLWLGPIYRGAGDDERAEAAFRTALELAPHAPDTWIAWVEHLALSKQRSRAMQELDRLKKELPADRQALTLARCYDAMHEVDRAAQAYAAILAARPNDLAPLLYAADFYRRADRPSEARKLYERLLGAGMPAPADVLVQARRHLAILLASTDPARALELVAANGKKERIAVADERIRLYIRGLDAQSRAEAIAQFEDGLRHQPASPQERVMLAEMLAAAGNLPQARTQLAAAVDDAPQQPNYLARYARLLIQTNELDEAANVIARLEALEPAGARIDKVKSALAAALAKSAAKKR